MRISSLAVLAVMLASTVAVPASSMAAQPQPQPGGAERTVTLRTGDRVPVDGMGRTKRIEPGQGRAGMQSREWTWSGGHHFAMPDDARELVRQNRLDPRRFDLTTLLDSGYDATHPELKGVVTESKDFTGSPDGVLDTVGHAAPRSPPPSPGGAGTPVSRRARLCSSARFAGGEGCPEDAILAGMEWAASKAKVVNMSPGGDSTDGADPLSQALNRLTAERGTRFVVAAGRDLGANDGPARRRPLGGSASLRRHGGRIRLASRHRFRH